MRRVQAHDMNAMEPSDLKSSREKCAIDCGMTFRKPFSKDDEL